MNKLSILEILGGSGDKGDKGDIEMNQEFKDFENSLNELIDNGDKLHGQLIKDLQKQQTESGREESSLNQKLNERISYITGIHNKSKEIKEEIITSKNNLKTQLILKKRADKKLVEAHKALTLLSEMKAKAKSIITQHGKTGGSLDEHELFYKQKYLKYKQKYLSLTQYAGSNTDNDAGNDAGNDDGNDDVNASTSKTNDANVNDEISNLHQELLSDKTNVKKLNINKKQIIAKIKELLKYVINKHKTDFKLINKSVKSVTTNMKTLIKDEKKIHGTDKKELALTKAESKLNSISSQIKQKIQSVKNEIDTIKQHTNDIQEQIKN